MAKIILMSKTLVTVDDDIGIGSYIEIREWSNLLEAASANDIPQLQELIREATPVEIRQVLSVLTRAFNICKKYEPAKVEYGEGLGGEWSRSYESAIKLAHFETIRKNILWNLKDEHYGSYLLEADWRIIEERLLKEVVEASSLPELIQLHRKYDNSNMLGYHGGFKGFRLFGRNFSPLKISFIAALQTKALHLLENFDDVLQNIKADIEALNESIFSSKYQAEGVDVRQREHFVWYFLNAVTSQWQGDVPKPSGDMDENDEAIGAGLSSARC